jgi:uncharacterized protein (DUF1330 family)
MAVYLIAQITINDRETYTKYSDGFMDIFSRFKGALLSVDEESTVLEGEWKATRTVLVTFPSKTDAMDWYNSADYQALAQHRYAASSGNIVMIEGLPAAAG